MAKFRKKPLIIEAHQWFKNGDHPDDYRNSKLILDPHVPNEMLEMSGAEQQLMGHEGQVIRRYNHPHVKGEHQCTRCEHPLKEHGWIDTFDGGLLVCPGDWIATQGRGLYAVIKPQELKAHYDPVE